MKKQRSASPSQAMPISARVARHPRDDVAAVLFDQRIGFVSGEGAVDREAERVDLARQRLEEFGRDQAGHAAAGVEHDLEWLDDGRIDEAEHVLDVPIEDRPLGETAGRRGRRRNAIAGDHVADIRNAARRR